MSIRLTLRIATAAFVVAVLAASTSVLGASGAPNRILATCTPAALVPSNAGGGGWFARANINCTGSVSWVGQIKLVKSDGTVLEVDAIAGSNSLSVFTDPPRACSGSVHTFVWINVDGTVKSDTSANVGC